MIVEYNAIITTFLPSLNTLNTPAAPSQSCAVCAWRELKSKVFFHFFDIKSAHEWRGENIKRKNEKGEESKNANFKHSFRDSDSGKRTRSGIH